MMYYILRILVGGISLLPMAMLYAFSSVTKFLIFDIAGYRKDIIHKNLKQAFPHKDEYSLRQIRKEFEQSFCDQWFEMMKLLSMSKEELQSRIRCDWTIFKAYAEEGISCNVLLGHQFNWEWANAITAVANEQMFVGLYMPQKPKAVDRLVRKIRSRMGSVLVEATSAHKSIGAFEGSVYLKGLIADQVPGNLKRSRWYSFLGAPCPFMTGPEWTAMKEKTAVAFAEIIKLKRGYYEIRLIEITRNASLERPGFITDRFVRLLSQSIQNQPANWLWSHRRWKRQLPPNTEVINLDS